MKRALFVLTLVASCGTAAIAADIPPLWFEAGTRSAPLPLAISPADVRYVGAPPGTREDEPGPRGGTHALRRKYARLSIERTLPEMGVFSPEEVASVKEMYLPNGETVFAWFNKDGRLLRALHGRALTLRKQYSENQVPDSWKPFTFNGATYYWIP